MRKLIAAVALVCAAATAAAAQSSPAAREDLSGLPESQVVVFVNARRITNEALPRLVPAARYAPLFDEAKRTANVDVRRIEYVLAGARFTDAPNGSSIPAEFGVVVRGGFNADALLSMARLAGQGRYREETRGGRTISVFKIDYDDEDKDENKGVKKDDAAASPKPKQELPQEIAAVALGPDALFVGTPAYVGAALDARAGAGPRVNADLVELALRDQGALVSLAAQLPPSVSKYIDAATGGAQSAADASKTEGGDAKAAADASKAAEGGFFSDEMRRLLDSIRQVQFSVNLAAAQFGAQAAARTDAPENARAISGLLAAGLNAVEGEMSKESAGRRGRGTSASQARALALLRSITNTVRDNEVIVSVSAPQTTVASYLQEAFAPPAAKKPPATRRTARPARRRA